jgi:hypothetical protein
MYDKAWRIALSYRYTRGSLLVVDDLTMPENSSPWFWKRFFEANPWGKHHGGCTFVKDRMDEDLFSAIAEFQDHCKRKPWTKSCEITPEIFPDHHPRLPTLKECISLDWICGMYYIICLQKDWSISRLFVI